MSGSQPGTRPGTLTGIGVGPGDPELLTLKAVRLLNAVDVLAYPANQDGDSLARAIAAPHLLAGLPEISLPMAFKPGQSPEHPAYDKGAKAIAEHLEAGRDVAFLCEGDPLFYGSFIYVLERLGNRFPMRVVPGVASPMACAALAQRPLVAGDEPLAILPATADDATLDTALSAVRAAVVMKLGRHLPRVAAALKRAGLAEGATVVVRGGLEGERILPLPQALVEGVPYFSLLLARKDPL
ncbi:precorrin-2 C(20)-methyltransferase [Rhodospirillum sp. A1_3_36]|uniref:precorrin-2 C(20)-methyltransferase n=1 Tax=Rhodospirillum sp. A1_3_36 TaxID=3391666 RepID=UPI0039A4B5FB